MPGRARFLAVLLCGLTVCCAGRAAAQFDSLPNVFPADSNEALKRLKTVNALLEQQQYGLAIELLQGLIEQFGDKVVPASPESKDLFINLQLFCHRKISRMPPDGLRFYRQQYDGQAAELLAESELADDNAPLERIVMEYFSTTAGAIALERLGDSAMLSGRYAEALSWWSKLLPDSLLAVGDPNFESVKAQRLQYPDAESAVARVAAKWTITQLFDGNPHRAGLCRQWLRERHPEAAGSLAGRRGKYWEIVSEVLSRPARYEPPPVGQDWLTFGGDGRRGRIAPEPVEIGAVQYRWQFRESAEPARSRSPFERVPRLGTEDQLACHPVIRGHKVFLATDSDLWTFDLETGKQRKWSSYTGDDPLARTASAANDKYTLTAAGNRLFVRTGTTITDFRMGPVRANRMGTESKLICFDHRSEERLWEVAARDVDPKRERNVVFEGAPVVAGDNVLIALTRLGVRSQSLVVCFDIETGVARWQTYICQATDESQRGGILHNLLTLADRTVYYGTNLGALAAIDAETGKLRWLNVYPRRRRPRSGYGSGMTPDLNPCVFHQGRLFLAASDTSRIQCFDADTGAKLWEASPPVQYLLGVGKGNLIATGDRVWGIDAESGRVQWRWPENTVPGYGRGVLAGDFVYWPTRTEIHVLDQRTGSKARPSIALHDRPLLKAGNMIVGDGYLVLAQANKLLAICPQGRLIEKLRHELVSRPNAAELHYRLADAALSKEEFDLAGIHFRQALEHAGREEVYEGKNLAALARRRLFEGTLNEADGARETRQFDKAERIYQRAIAIAPTAASRLTVLRSRAEMWSAAGNAMQEAAVYQSIIEDREVGAARADRHNGTRVSAREWAANELARLIAEHGKDIYQRFETVAEKRMAEAQDPTEFLALAEKYPFARIHGELLFSAARSLEEKGDLHAARRVFNRLWRSPDVEERLQLEGLLGAARLSQRHGLVQPSRLLLDRLLREFAEHTLPGSNDRSVRDFVDDQRSLLGTADRRTTQGGLLQKHRQFERGGIYAIPEGHVPSRRFEAVYDITAETIVCRGVADSKPRWSIEVHEAVQWLCHSPEGLIIATDERLTCHAYDTGETIWESSLTNEASPNRWGSSTFWRSRPTVVSADPSRDTPAGGRSPTVPESDKFTLAGDLVLAIRGNRLLAFAIDDGQTAWERELGADMKGVRLSLTGTVATLQCESRILGVDALTGRSIFEAPLRRGVSGRDVVEAAGFLVVVTDRHELTAINTKTGRTAWTRRFVWPTFALPQLFSDGQICCVVVDGYILTRVEPQTGEVLWDDAIALRPRARGRNWAALADGRFVSHADGWVESRALSDGRRQWRQRLPSEASSWSLRLQDHRLMLITHDERESRLLAFDVADGRPTQVLRFSPAGKGASWLFGDGFAVVAGSRHSWLLADASLPSITGRAE